MRRVLKKIRGFRQIDVRRFTEVDWIPLSLVEGETGVSAHLLRRAGLTVARIGNRDHLHIGQVNAWIRRPDLQIPSIASVAATTTPTTTPIIGKAGQTARDQINASRRSARQTTA